MKGTGSNLKAVLFDMDGTLVNSLDAFLHCENKISLKYAGKRLSLEEVFSGFGPAASDIVRNITAGLPAALQNRAVSDFYDCWKRSAVSKVFVFPGVIDLLQRIRASGKRVALVTGVERIMMEYTLRPFDLSKFFDTLVSLDDVKKGKPDPQGIFLALKRLGITPEESIYIGDSPTDILAGKHAGVMTGAAMWVTPQTRKDPTSEHPDHTFRSIKQLTDFLFSNIHEPTLVN